MFGPADLLRPGIVALLGRYGSVSEVSVEDGPGDAIQVQYHLVTGERGQRIVPLHWLRHNEYERMVAHITSDLGRMT
jgi:hypothetical protein